MKSIFLSASIYIASALFINIYAQIPGDECNNPIAYPGDVVNSVCISSYDFSSFTDSPISPYPTCDFGGDASAWFTFTAPVVTGFGNPLFLSFDDGDGLINDCNLGIQFFSTDCFRAVSNCLPNTSGTIGGLTQGDSYLMLVWDDQMGGFSCDFCLTLAPTPPPGNECDDAIPYTGDILNETCMTGFDFTGYTGSVTSPLISCGPIGDYSSWFTVTTPVTTNIGDPIDLFFDNGDGLTNDCDLSVEFYALDCNTPVSNCYVVNGGIITGLVQGTDYLMLIDNQFGDTICDFCLILPPPPPPNNDCSGATPYPANIANGGCVSNFDFAGYTDSGLSPSPSCDTGDPNAWYTFTAPITTAVGDPITLQWNTGYYCYVGIEIFEPDCMTPVSSCLNNFSGSVPGLIQGNNYYAVIWADGNNNNYCDFCLSVPSPPPSVPGSQCSNPIPYPGDITNGICVDNFDFGNLNNPGQNPCGFPETHTAWFTVTTPVTSALGDPIDLAFEAEYNESSIQFYSIGCTSAIGNCIEYGGVATGLQQGTDYLMAVSKEIFGNTIADFCVTVAPPPHLNDECSGAIPYPGDVVNGVCIDNYNFLIANGSGMIDIPSCDSQHDPTVWFSWTAPIITTAGDPIDLIFDSGQGQEDNCYLGIEFYDLDCTTPVSNCLDNFSNVITGLVQGEDYLMVIFDDSPGASVCDFCLYIAPPPAQGNECNDPLPYPGDISSSTCVNGVDFSNYTHTNDSPLIYCTLPYQTVWYTITTPVTTMAGDPLELFFNAENCDLSILFANANCINGLNNCMEGSGMVTGLEQGRDYLFTVNNSASSNGEICDFCLTHEETCASVDMSILFDGTPGQTSWEITDNTGATVASSGGTYTNQTSNSILNLNAACLPDGCYNLIFYDALNNGMCPFQSNAVGVSTFITAGTLITPGSVVGTLSLVATPGLCGNYNLYDANGSVLASGGGAFGGSETNNFCIVDGVAPKYINPGLDLKELEILPNPVEDHMIIKFDDRNTTELVIINILGETLQVYSTNTLTKNARKLDISNLKAGTYLVQAKFNDGHIATQKFIKK